MDHDCNDIGSIIMDNTIKIETDLSDNKMVWQTSQDDHGKLVDTNNQIKYLTYDLYACGTTDCLNTSNRGNDCKTTKEYQSFD